MPISHTLISGITIHRHAQTHYLQLHTVQEMILGSLPNTYVNSSHSNKNTMFSVFLAGTKLESMVDTQIHTQT